MTQRERTMATALGSGIILVVVVGGAVLFINAFVNSNKNIEELEATIAANQAKIKSVAENGPRLERWRQLSNYMAEVDDKNPKVDAKGQKISMAGNIDWIRGAYRDYLENSIRDHHMILELYPPPEADSKSQIVHPSKGSKLSMYTGLNFNVRVKAKLGDLVSFVHDFQKKPYMHRIKSMVIERSNSSKDGEYLTVTFGFENLVILDAELSKKKKPVPETRFLAVDTLVGFGKGLPGLGMFTWYLSPQGNYVNPLNPPFGARDYFDISHKNFFFGPSTPVPEIKTKTKTITPPTDYRPAKDEEINMMRFTRLVSMTTDDQGAQEAHLWDLYHNKKPRLKTSAAFRTFDMVKTSKAEPIIQGIVKSIEGSDVVFRVTLKAYDANTSKWWRYPNSKDYYTLHPEDFATLEKSGKVTAADKGSLYLINQPYWEELTAKGASKVELAPDGKTFRFLNVLVRGEIVFSDAFVLIARLNGPPPKKADAPSVAASRVYPEANMIYRIQFKHFDELVLAGKGGAAAAPPAAGKKGGPGGGPGGKNAASPVVKTDLDRVYAMHASFWDALTTQKIVRPYGNTFSFYSDLVDGEIISRTDDLVVFRVYEKYCKCSADPDLGIKEHYHEGFLVLRIGNFVQGSLQHPLDASLVPTFLKK